MKWGWSVKPSLAPRKVEGQLDSITKKARNGIGQKMVLKAIPLSKEHRHMIHASEPRSWKSALFTWITTVAEFWIHASSMRTLVRNRTWLPTRGTRRR
jgi:hypothetical protein